MEKFSRLTLGTGLRNQSKILDNPLKIGIKIRNVGKVDRSHTCHARILTEENVSIIVCDELTFLLVRHPLPIRALQLRQLAGYQGKQISLWARL